MFSMGNTHPSDLPNWVFLGDNSCTALLSWLLPGVRLALDKNNSIWVYYGVKASITHEKGRYIVKSPLILPQMTLCFPTESDSHSLPGSSKGVKYAVLESFPFRKQSSIDLVQELESCKNEVLVVLMDLPRHQASTDLLAPGKDLEQAIHAYQKEHRDVAAMHSPEDLNRILHWHRPIYNTWVNIARSRLSEMNERIGELPYDFLWIEEDWKDGGGILQEQTLDKLFSYENVLKAREKNLWDSYAVISKRALFPSSGKEPLMPVVELYRDCLNNPLIFLPTDTETEDFLEDLQVLFVKKLGKSEAEHHYRQSAPFPAQLSEDSYLRLLAVEESGSGTALNAVFRELITDYLCVDVEKCLEEKLNKLYQGLYKQLYPQLEVMSP